MHFFLGALRVKQEISIRLLEKIKNNWPPTGLVLSLAANWKTMKTLKDYFDRIIQSNQTLAHSSLFLGLKHP